MPGIRSSLAGQSSLILVVALPQHLNDETATLVRDEVAHKLPNADGAAAILDFREVDLINSIGITCLLQVQDDCRRRHAGFMLAGVPQNIVNFLTTLRLVQRFPRADTVELAVASFDRPA